MVVSLPASDRADAPHLMNQYFLVSPEDLADAAELQWASCWAALRVWLIPLVIFMILHFARRIG